MVTRTMQDGAQKDAKYILLTTSNVLNDSDVTTLDKVVRQYQEVVKQLSNFGSSDDYINIPVILEVIEYVEVKVNRVLVGTKVPHGSKNRNKPVKFHHWDREIKESQVIEIVDVDEVQDEVEVVESFLHCGLCNGATDTVTSIQGSLLRVGSRKYHDTDIIDGIETPKERIVKFPTYLAVHICKDCVSAFTILCAERDTRFNSVKAKFRYSPVVDKRRLDVHMRNEVIDRDNNYSSESAGYLDVDAAMSGESVELVDPHYEKSTLTGYKSHVAKTQSKTPSKAARLKPSTQNVFEKPSKKYRVPSVVAKHRS